MNELWSVCSRHRERVKQSIDVDEANFVFLHYGKRNSEHRFNTTLWSRVRKSYQPNHPPMSLQADDRGLVWWRWVRVDEDGKGSLTWRCVCGVCHLPLRASRRGFGMDGRYSSHWRAYLKWIIFHYLRHTSLVYNLSIGEMRWGNRGGWT